MNDFIRITSLIIYFIFCSMVCGCCRVPSWVNQSFNQGTQLATHDQSVYRNIRAISIHNQYALTGMFDCMLVNQRLHEAYAATYVQLYHHLRGSYDAILQERKALFDQGISFYMLALADGDSDVPATTWTITLEKNGMMYEPSHIVPIILDPIMTFLFGERVTRFRQAYMVQFAQVRLEPCDTIRVFVRTFDREGVMAWHLNNGDLKDVPYESYPHF